MNVHNKNEMSKRSLNMTSPLFFKGATLLELMIVVGILALVSTLGVSSYVSMITKSRITAETNELNSLLRFARFTAIELEKTTILCPSTNFEACSKNWNEAKMVFIDMNQNGKKDSEEQILMSISKKSRGNIISSGNNSIRFYDSGVTASPAGLLICPSSNHAKYARRLTVSLQGRLRLSRDENEDGIHEDSDGKPLECVSSSA